MNQILERLFYLLTSMHQLHVGAQTIRKFTRLDFYVFYLSFESEADGITDGDWSFSGFLCVHSGFLGVHESKMK